MKKYTLDILENDNIIAIKLFKTFNKLMRYIIKKKITHYEVWHFHSGWHQL